MSLSIKGIKSLCEVTGKEKIYDVTKDSVAKHLRYYEAKGNGYHKVTHFLQKVAEEPYADWVDQKALTKSLLKSYKKLKSKSKVEKIAKVYNDSYSYVFELSDIELIVNSFEKNRKVVRSVLAGCCAVCAICGGIILLPSGQDKDLEQFVSVEIDNTKDTENVVVVSSLNPKQVSEVEEVEKVEEIEVEDEQTKKPKKDYKEESKEIVEEHKEIAWLNVDFDQLQKVNGDVRAYILFESTGISYPILGCADNDKYLSTDWKGNYSYAGSLYVDCQNSFDFTDPMTIVYGHNMKNGSMFGCLKKYQDSKYLDSNKYVQIAIPGEVKRYEVVKFSNVDVSSNFFNLNSFGLRDTLKDVMNFEYNLGDRVVALSTCTGLGYKSRFVVLLKEII